MVPTGAARRGRPHRPSRAAPGAAAARAPWRGLGRGGLGPVAGGGSSAALSRALGAGSAAQQRPRWPKEPSGWAAGGSAGRGGGDGGGSRGPARAGWRAAHVTQTRAPHPGRGAGAGRGRVGARPLAGPPPLYTPPAATG